MSKRCCRCGKIKPLSEFYNCTSYRDGHDIQCISCAKACYTSSYKKDREKFIARTTLFRLAHPEEDKERRRQYRLRNLKELRKRESLAAKLYRQTPKGILNSLTSRNSRRAREASCQINDLDSTQIEALLSQAQSCAICSGEFEDQSTTKKKSLDHIVPLSRGGQNTLANVRVVHKGCNSSKGNRLDKSLTLATCQVN